MARARVRLSQLAIAFWSAFAAASISSPGLALETSSATLASGQTTHDGKLTLMVVSSATTLRVPLKNNDLRTVVIDAYALSGPSYCTGKYLQIPSNETRSICTVPVTPDANLGHASLQVSVTWHEMPRPRPSATPAAFPSPYRLPSPSP
jgi:hypothetical protein